MQSNLKFLILFRVLDSMFVLSVLILCSSQRGVGNFQHNIDQACNPVICKLVIWKYYDLFNEGKQYTSIQIFKWNLLFFLLNKSWYFMLLTTQLWWVVYWVVQARRSQNSQLPFETLDVEFARQNFYLVSRPHENWCFEWKTCGLICLYSPLQNKTKGTLVHDRG